MKKQFLHEQSNRKDRSKSCDYRADLSEVTDAKSHPESVVRVKEDWEEKGKLIEKYKNGECTVENRYFKHAWQLQDFITIYGTGSAPEYLAVKKSACIELDAVIGAIRDGKIVDDFDSGKMVLAKSVKTSCHPAC